MTRPDKVVTGNWIMGTLVPIKLQTLMDVHVFSIFKQSKTNNTKLQCDK